MKIEQTFTWFPMKEYKPPDAEDVELLLNIVYCDNGIRKDYVAHGITQGGGLIYSPDRGFFRLDEDYISHWAFFPVSPTINAAAYIFKNANRMGDNQCGTTPT